MAGDQENMVISKNNSGFPGYLDFDKLRTEGIDYLGKLSGKIWTDHNVHDPGITILEMLCYALLDLGYRTNLPVEDLLTRNPDDGSKDNNFFTPAQILACNPLTITDFRKLLIDIEGVKNAWLEIATDQKDFCRPRWQEDPAGGNAGNNESDEPCIDFLNGLYHIYIDLENEVEEKIKDDPEEKEKFEAKIKDALMAHRNLCEDFIDIYFLCKQETGVCADIELEDNADVEKAYIDIVEKLRTFFSPAPRFYTLPQLLEKQKPIDEIFAGRPYNITESHGFVDTKELEQLKLRKEIHLSDVYHVLFEVEGVKAIHNLRLQTCNAHTTNPVKGWKYHIPQNHVPEFSLDCSGFQFKRNGMPVFIDVRKFEGLFEINFTHNGKVLHQSPSPYLDSDIPKGIYRKDLGDYYSIQNEFPRVYGIAEGGLPDGASPLRKAQAYQLKAYLLFFDQLLANYLSQLQHIRSLFALPASDNEEESHTYFINRLSSVPDLQQLLRFNSSESNANALGTAGTILVLPVDKMKLLELKDNDKLKTLSPGDFEPYTFSTMAEQDTAISQLKNDLVFDQHECVYVTAADGCIYYYMLTSSDEMALVSKKYFSNLQEAAENAASLKYIGTFSENYRSFVTAAGNFSFDIELNLLTFEKYLQLIVENGELFSQRRQQFLDHLLSRFAEQFTDYALLSFGFLTDQQLPGAVIKGKENFLTHYDDLSSNRGKAYDYLENNWNNGNVSGFENKVKAISGIANRKRSLCNFEVAEYEEQFEVILKIAGASWFTINEKFDTRDEALMAAKALFSALPGKSNYQPEFIEHDNAYKLTLHYAPNRSAAFPLQYTAKEEAMAVAGNITELFIPKDPAASIFESTYKYIPRLNDSNGKQVRRSVAFYPSEEEARKAVLKTITKIDDRKKWEYGEDVARLGTLIYDVKNTVVLSYINADAFKIDVNNSIVGKPDQFTYDLLDKENNFKFQSVNEFNNAAEALTDAAALLGLLTGEQHYEIFRNAATGKFAIRVADQGAVRAVCIIENNTEAEAEQLRLLILDIVKKNRYFIEIEKEPHRWKFNYSLGYEKNSRYLFYSVRDYTTPEEALAAATLFHNASSTLRVDAVKHELFLVADKDDIAISSVKLIDEGEPKDIIRAKAAVDKLLLEQKEITRLTESTSPAAFSDSVRIDPVSEQGLFVYRLIDKDRPLAFYSRSFADKTSARPDIKSLAKLFKYGAAYLQVCMGGDIINKRKDEDTKITWYHYQLKCLNQFYPSGPLAGKPLILFESTQGYQNSDDAEKAFTENYLLLIHRASDPVNYGKSISLAETVIHNANAYSSTDDSIVFVPAATKDALGAADNIVIAAMVKMALTYPIRLVQYKSKTFYELFSCEQNPGDQTTADNCIKKNEPYVYYFTLLSPEQGAEKWQSVKFYTSSGEAKKEFDFFVMLLWYQGNYYADCDHCADSKTVYRVYLREVLAESAERFITEEQAWGKEGVQKLICTSQTENAFHTYRRKEDCCYSFYVACGAGLVYHPCKYDTPQKRDNALIKLYQSLKETIKKKAWQAEDNDNAVVLRNDDGTAFAAVAINSRDNNCISDRITDLTRYVDSAHHYKEEEGRIVLRDDQNEIIAGSLQKDITLTAWKEMLQLFVCYYPVKKTKDIKSGGDTYRYCIEIKLPGFNTCKEDMTEEKPCGCGSEAGEDEASCYIAWKGDCCYPTCAEAELALQTIMRLLLDFSYYQPVFDCGCYSYGIAIQFSRNAIIADENITWYWQEATIRNWHSSEIVAVNPQCYTNAEMSCEAVARAKELINSEGLHVVEHILLRPRCNPEDCRCSQYNKQCDDETGCRFVWPVQDEDPCTEEKDICFVPGADRYSFIATVVLPAWPERFRKKENRALLENILYREAPAHILLRILWLAPHDFCCFETKFKSWGRWLAQKKNCVDDFSVCDFLAFLFDRNYECLDDCMVCLPCEDNVQQPGPCFAQGNDGEEKNKYLSQINELYCWYDQHCDQYKFTPCVRTEPRNPDIPGTLLLNVAGRSDEAIAEAQSAPVSISGKSLVEKKTETGLPDKDIVKRKRQVVNGRLAKYRKVADNIFEKSGNNAIAAKVQRFLSDPHPTRERLSKLIIEVLQNKTPEKPVKPLTKKQARELLQTGTCYFLDKLCFNGKDKIKPRELKTVFEKLRKAETDIKALYAYWNFAEIAVFQPALNETLLNDLFFPI